MECSLWSAPYRSDHDPVTKLRKYLVSLMEIILSGEGAAL